MADIEVSHEMMLAKALTAALVETDLEAVAEEAGLAPLREAAGAPVDVDEAGAKAEYGFLGDDHGVWVRLSDGSEFVVSISRYRNPR